MFEKKKDETDDSDYEGAPRQKKKKNRTPKKKKEKKRSSPLLRTRPSSLFVLAFLPLPSVEFWPLFGLSAFISSCPVQFVKPCLFQVRMLTYGYSVLLSIRH